MIWNPTKKLVDYINKNIRGRSDLRSWELSYSNVYGTNIFSKSKTNTNVIDSEGVETEDYSLYIDNNAFDQMIHFTLGSSLPFIFQPDEDNFMPDQFAISRFGSNSFEMTRDGTSEDSDTYSYSINIQEAF